MSNAISAANAYLQWLGLGARKVHRQMANVQKSGCSSFFLHRRQVVSWGFAFLKRVKAGKPSHQFLCSLRMCCKECSRPRTTFRSAMRCFLLGKTSLKWNKDLILNYLISFDFVWIHLTWWNSSRTISLSSCMFGSAVCIQPGVWSHVGGITQWARIVWVVWVVYLDISTYT